MVKIFVGEDGDNMKVFIVHRELLTIHEPELFIQILGDIGKETIFLLEEDTHMFFGLLQYAYRRRFFFTSTTENVRLLWDLCIFAEKRGIQGLQDIVMNKVIRYYIKTDSLPSMHMIEYVYSRTSPQVASSSSTPSSSSAPSEKSSMARRFMVRCYVSISMGALVGMNHETEGRIARTLRSTEGLLQDTLVATSIPVNGPWKMDLDPRKVDRCQYHQHGWYEECPRSREACCVPQRDE